MIKSRYIFNRRNRLNSDNQAPIHLEVYIDRETRKLYSTGIFITQEQWDPSTNLLKKNAHFNYLNINQFLKDLIKSVDDFIYDTQRSGYKVSRESLDWHIENFLKGQESNIGQPSFNEFCISSLDEEKSKLENSTYKDVLNTLTTLNEFKPSIQFQDLNYELIRSWDNYLHDKKYGTNTIWKKHKNVKRFINIAINKGIIHFEDNPYLKFKTKQEKSKRVDLTFEEISRIEALEYGIPEYMQLTRDIFLFSCYTGLRFSDIMNLKTSYLTRTSDGICIELEKMIKVRRPVFLPIEILFNGKALIILKRYLGDDLFNKIGQRMEYKPVFPSITNQEINRHLKVLAYDAKLNKHLTYHVSRHTFGTNLADLTGDVFLIMDLMGISKQDTAMIYIHSSRERTTQKLKKIAW